MALHGKPIKLVTIVRLLSSHEFVVALAVPTFESITFSLSVHLHLFLIL